jgi:hypothetical protein
MPALGTSLTCWQGMSDRGPRNVRSEGRVRGEIKGAHPETGQSRCEPPQTKRRGVTPRGAIHFSLRSRPGSERPSLRNPCESCCGVEFRRARRLSLKSHPDFDEFGCRG